MKNISAEDIALTSLRIEDITPYLRCKGWKHSQSPNDRLIVFEGQQDDEGQTIELILPQRNDYVDTYVRLADAINLLAAVENRSPNEIIKAIKALGEQRY